MDANIGLPNLSENAGEWNKRNAANKGFFQRNTVKRTDNRLSMMPASKGDPLADAPAPTPVPAPLPEIRSSETKAEKSPERVEKLADKLAEKPADKNLLKKMRQSAFFSKPKDSPGIDVLKKVDDKDHKRMSSQQTHQSIDSLKLAIQEKSKLCTISSSFWLTQRWRILIPWTDFKVLSMFQKEDGSLFYPKYRGSWTEDSPFLLQ